MPEHSERAAGRGLPMTRSCVSDRLYYKTISTIRQGQLQMRIKKIGQADQGKPIDWVIRRGRLKGDR